MNNPSFHHTISISICLNSLLSLCADVYLGLKVTAKCREWISNLNQKHKIRAGNSFLTQFAVLTHLHSICWRLLPTLIDAHGHISRFRAMLVAHKDAVSSRIVHGDIVDSDAAALGFLSDGKLALANNLPVVPKPEDLRSWCTIDEACQTQRLRTGGVKNIWNKTEKGSDLQKTNTTIVCLCVAHLFHTKGWQ